MKKIELLTFLLIVVCNSYYIFGQTTYTWTGATDNLWTTATNWSPSRSAPATNDVIVFSASGTITVTAVPTQTIGQLSVSGSTTVNLQAGAASNILTIGGGTGTDLTVGAGSQLNIDDSYSYRCNWGYFRKYDVGWCYRCYRS